MQSIFLKAIWNTIMKKIYFGESLWKTKTKSRYHSFRVAAQDRSPFCIFHILNEFSLHPQLIDKFIVRNHSPNF